MEKDDPVIRVEEVMEEEELSLEGEPSMSMAAASASPLALVPHRKSFMGEPTGKSHNNSSNDNDHDDEVPQQQQQQQQQQQNVGEANRRRALVDSERQILLLMLLAQVCSLHDPTPRTFTVHVLSLYERGLLDYSSIRFLFDLGLVPALQEENQDTNRLAGLVSMQQARGATTDMEGRARQVTDIRTRLEEYDAVQAFPKVQRSHSAPSPTRTERKADTDRRSNSSDGVSTGHPLQSESEEQDDDDDNEEEEEEVDAEVDGGMGVSDDHDERREGHGHANADATKDLPRRTSSDASTAASSSSSWAVDQHPLQLSRYQRDFVQLHRLGGGSFGDVYKVRNKLDDEIYAMKRVLFSARGYSNESVQRVLREVQCLAKCDHVNCIRYYTSWLEPSWMTGGSSTSTASAPNMIGSADDLADRNTQRRLLADIQRLVLATDTPGGGLAQMPKHLSIEEENDEDLDEDDEDEEETYDTRELEDTTNNVSSYGPLNYFKSRGVSRQDSYKKLIQTYDSIPVGGPPAVSHDDDDDDDDDESEWGSYATRSRANPPAGRLWRRPSSSSGIDESDIDKTKNENDNDDDDVSWDWASSGHNSRQISPHGKAAQQRHEYWGARRASHDAKKTTRPQYNYQICLFIQMQLCQSTTLADWIREKRHLGNPWKIVHQVVAGLCHIHESGIIHRDLKPSNIFDAGNDIFKIGDFGLSKLLSCSSDNHDAHDETARGVWRRHGDTDENADSHHTAGVGTASYAAPEQLEQKKQDVASSYGPQVDIYSLGLILLELFCPVTSAHERAVLFRQCRDQRVVSIPSHSVVASLILACTDPRPDARPTAVTLQRQLQQAAAAKTTITTTTTRDNLTWWKSEVARQAQLLKEKDALISQLQAQVSQLQKEASLRLSSSSEEMVVVEEEED